MRRFSPLTLAFVTLVGVTRLASAAIDETPLVRSGISIQLPAGWKIQPSESKHLLLAACAPSPDSDNTGDYAPVIACTVAPGSVVDGDAQQKRLAGDVPSYQPVETPTHVTLNGIDAVTFGGTFTNNSVKLRTRQYLLTAAGKVYTLTFTALDSRWPQRVETAVASITTFKLVK